MTQTRKKVQFVKDLGSKDAVNSVFLVKHIALMKAKDGKSYLNLVVADNTGDLECRAWGQAEEIEERVKKGAFVQLHGKVNFYQGRKQVIVEQVENIESEEIDKEDFVIKAKRPAEEMFAELQKIVEGLSDFYIRTLLQNVLEDREISRRLKLWPAGKSIHHAYQSGLLEHILSCANLSVYLSKVYQVNENYVVAGAILHDLCKVYELSDGLTTDYTEEGKLVGHLVKGVEIIDRFSYRIQNFPYDLKLHLKHIILSHHGEYEYGSPKVPSTKEAYLVHLIDYLDSKMHSMETICMTDTNSGHWSGFIRHLDRMVYKKELPFYPEALAEAPSRSTPQKKAPANSKKPAYKAPKDPTKSMGSLLKDFKVED